jgi:hypothetical protein
MSAKAPSSRQIASLVSLALKTVGVIMILAALLDIITFLIPFEVSDRPWLVNVVTQVVDRGIIPMIGVALVLTGFWVDGNSPPPVNELKNWQDLRFWAVLLASVLGIFYVLLIPLHLNNVRLNYSQALERIDEEATQAENQLTQRLGAEVDQQRAQIGRLIAADDDQIQRAIEAKAINQEQADQIRKFRQDPASVDPYLKQRADQLRTQLQTEVGVRKEETRNKARTESWKSGIRVGLSSLMLAIGFSIIGWTGLKILGQSPERRPS